MQYLFPNGIGTRALLAMLLIGAYAIGSQTVDRELVLLVLGFYFATRDRQAGLAAGA